MRLRSQEPHSHNILMTLGVQLRFLFLYDKNPNFRNYLSQKILRSLSYNSPKKSLLAQISEPKNSFRLLPLPLSLEYITGAIYLKILTAST